MIMDKFLERSKYQISVELCARWFSVAVPMSTTKSNVGMKGLWVTIHHGGKVKAGHYEEMLLAGLFSMVCSGSPARGSHCQHCAGPLHITYQFNKFHQCLPTGRFNRGNSSIKVPFSQMTWASVKK